MLEKIQIFRELSALFSGAEIGLLSNSEEEVRDYLWQTVSPWLGAGLSSKGFAAQLCTLDSSYIYELTPLPGVVALVYTVPTQILIVGPVTTEGFTVQKLYSYLQQQDLPHRTMDHFAESAGRLPRMCIHSLYRLTDLLLRYVFDRVLPVPVKPLEQPIQLDLQPVFPETAPQQQIHQIRLVENRYEISTLLTEAVRQGNLSLALQTLQNRGGAYETIVRNKNPLRNMQNQCIILNTQLRHSFEDLSIHPYELDQLSNEIGLQIERLTSTETATAFATYIIGQYCRLVQKHTYQHLSPLVHQAVIYVKNNLSSNLTVKDTARELSIHPDYLSHQFSQEMGMPFITFLNRERCRQAAEFLKHTNLQIKQISALVGFNTISYFTKQFTHFFDKSPRDYRNERTLKGANL